VARGEQKVELGQLRPAAALARRNTASTMPGTAAGSWYTPQAGHYIASVKEYMNERIWESPAFRDQSQPGG
jgi:hypothetical protein